jgi:pimeloyl-ACP methyl ester carboxylesterase
MKIDIQRIIGLKIFNSIGEHKYDSLPVLFFNLPDGMPINKYSYRSNESMAPDDYKKGLNAINKPLLVIVGSNDEAFVASAFESAVTNNSKGKVIVIDGADHNTIIYNNKALECINEWMASFDFTDPEKR